MDGENGENWAWTPPIDYSYNSILLVISQRGGGGGNGEMANLTNEKGKFAIAIFRHFSPFFAIGSF